MPTVKIAIVIAILAGLVGLLACKENNGDEQQVSASRAAAATQSTAQKPNEKPEADKGKKVKKVQPFLRVSSQKNQLPSNRPASPEGWSFA